MKRVAALFVDPRGPYPTLRGVDTWDETRDAMRYDGPHPVVVHPPCHLWVNFAALNFKRYGGEHNRPGNDGGKFAHALSCVRRFGGVLEHPASSKAWLKFRLTRPPKSGGWIQMRSNEWVCEVWQSAYGHPARKRTWLFYVGDRKPEEANWSRLTGTHQVGWFDRIKPTLSKRDASKTPDEFARFLVQLARRARI